MLQSALFRLRPIFALPWIPDDTGIADQPDFGLKTDIGKRFGGDGFYPLSDGFDGRTERYKPTFDAVVADFFTLRDPVCPLRDDGVFANVFLYPYYL